MAAATNTAKIIHAKVLNAGPLDLRHAAERWWCSGRVGHAVAETGRREGVQEVLSDETTDEARGTGKTKPPGKRG